MANRPVSLDSGLRPKSLQHQDRSRRLTNHRIAIEGEVPSPDAIQLLAYRPLSDQSYLSVSDQPPRKMENGSLGKAGLEDGHAPVLPTKAKAEPNTDQQSHDDTASMERTNPDTSTEHEVDLPGTPPPFLDEIPYPGLTNSLTENSTCTTVDEHDGLKTTTVVEASHRVKVSNVSEFSPTEDGDFVLHDLGTTSDEKTRLRGEEATRTVLHTTRKIIEVKDGEVVNETSESDTLVKSSSTNPQVLDLSLEPLPELNKRHSAGSGSQSPQEKPTIIDGLQGEPGSHSVSPISVDNTSLPVIVKQRSHSSSSSSSSQSSKSGKGHNKDESKKTQGGQEDKPAQTEKEETTTPKKKKVPTATLR